MSKFSYSVELSDSKSIKSAASITFSAAELRSQEISSFPAANEVDFERVPLKQLTMIGPFKMWSTVLAELSNTSLFIYKDDSKKTVLYEFQLSCLHTTRHVQNAFLTEDESNEDPVLKRDISFYAHVKERVNMATGAYAKRLIDSSSEDRNTIYKMTWTWEKGTFITWRPVFMVISETHLIFMTETPKSSDDFLGAQKFKIKECNARALEINEIFDPFHVHAILINKPNGPSFVSFDYGHERLFMLKIFKNAILRGFSTLPDLTYGCTSQGRSCQLVLSLKTGFTLIDKSNGLPLWTCRFDDVKTLYSHKENLHVHIRKTRSINRDASVQSFDDGANRAMLKKAILNKSNSKSPLSPTSPVEGIKEETMSFANPTIPFAIINMFQNMTSRLLLQDKP